ncbi:hypothetical protein L6452_01483 [Arctium lappa]|uniref:Uncharacterized protein n=1 Tax=Arctium lappa TaxID=4217 RepID=A0ACB9FGT5_ARCLA|nr:hypothetical protein L6452_01483 [Arctium lappa]
MVGSEESIGVVRRAWCWLIGIGFGVSCIRRNKVFWLVGIDISVLRSCWKGWCRVIMVVGLRSPWEFNIMTFGGFGETRLMNVALTMWETLVAASGMSMNGVQGLNSCRQKCNWRRSAYMVLVEKWCVVQEVGMRLGLTSASTKVYRQRCDEGDLKSAAD